MVRRKRTRDPGRESQGRSKHEHEMAWGKETQEGRRQEQKRSLRFETELLARQTQI